jgi:hypothetical protein
MAVSVLVCLAVAADLFKEEIFIYLSFSEMGLCLYSVNQYWLVD